MSSAADTALPSGIPAAQTQEPAAERLSDVAQLPKTDRHDFIERAWRFFCSTKLMVVLMFMFAASMAIGTFLNPKDDSLITLERDFAGRPFFLWFIHAFELYAPFQSWWFTSVILLLALNNLASSIERLPRIFLIVRNPERRLTDDFMRGLRNKRTAPRGPLDEQKIQSTFEAAGYHVSRITEGATTYLFGERGWWTRFGVWVVHLALLIICFGGLYGRLFAFEGTMQIPAEGGRLNAFLERMPDGTILRHPLGFAIQCNQFHLDKFKDGSARRYASDLAVYDLAGQKILDKHIIVNDPLDYGGMKFYQATFTERPDMQHASMELTDNATGETKNIEATPDHPFSMGDGHIRYQVVDYKPDFGELGEAVEVVREEDPPVVPVGVTAKAQEPAQTAFWVFKDYPDFDKKFRGDAFGLKFKELAPAYYTGIQVARDPGVPWIYLGNFLLWPALLLSFWTVHRRVWARIEPDKVVLAGAAHRNREVFSEEFTKLLVSLGDRRGQAQGGWMIVLDAKFEKSSPGFAGAPKADLPEVCFVGRSNVGKSSALNVLTARRKLARVSHTPGRTRLLNFFRVDIADRTGPGSRKGALRFCDLPGYGFAKGPSKERAEWGEWITEYLAKRESLSAVIMLVDGEIGVQPKDKDMIDLLAASHRQIIVVATKTDRLPKTRREASLDRVARDLKVPRSAVFAFSSKENIGHDELWRALCAATGLLGRQSERILEPTPEAQP